MLLENRRQLIIYVVMVLYTYVPMWGDDKVPKEMVGLAIITIQSSVLKALALKILV